MPKSPLKIWLQAARPKTLWAAVSPVLIGTAMAIADGGLHIPSALAALIGAILIQIGTNFANDYYDFAKGADTAARVGPTRATQAGLITPESMQRAFILVFALAILLGTYLVWRGGWVIVAIGLISVFLGILYTATPWALAYTGLADLFVLVFFGPVAVGGTYYVQTLTIRPVVLAIGLAPGLISMAILTVNNLRDIEDDRRARKRTLAVRFGATFAKWEYGLAVGAALVLPAVVYATTGEGVYSIFAMLTMLLAAPVIRSVFLTTDANVLNATLAQTGKVLLLFSVIFSIGWVLSAGTGG